MIVLLCIVGAIMLLSELGSLTKLLGRIARALERLVELSEEEKP